MKKNVKSFKRFVNEQMGYDTDQEGNERDKAFDVHEEVDWLGFESKFMSDPEVKAALDLIRERFEAMVPDQVKAVGPETEYWIWQLQSDTLQDFGPDKDEVNVWHMICWEKG
jgi:hypothetical protein